MPRLGPYRWLIALIVAALALAAPSLSSAAADTRPPTAPTALAAVPATYGATLTWAASRDNVGVKYYLVTVAGQIKRPTTPKAWIGSLTPNTAYTATVRAVDAAGNKSSAASVSFRTLVIPPDTTPPSTPGALTATATATSATLSWAPATDNVAVTGYVVAAAGRSFTVTGTSALVTPLAPDTSYPVSVVATDAAGNRSAPALLSVRTAPPPDTTPPTPPSGLLLTPGFTEVTATWSAATDNKAVAHYRVTIPGQAPLSVTSTSATVTGLSPDTAYVLSVTAVDTSGNASSAVTAGTRTLIPPDTTPPTAPGAPEATPGHDSAELSWPAAGDDRGVTGYQVSVGDQSFTTTTTTVSVTGLSPQTAYPVTVHALDAAGNLSDAATGEFTTLPPPDVSAPSAPTGLTASGQSTSSVTVSWNAATDDVGVTAYRVTGGTRSVTVADTTATLTGLAEGTTITLTVVAIDAAGNVSAPGSVNARTLVPPDTQAPSAPTVSVVPGAQQVAITVGGSSDDRAVWRYSVNVARQNLWTAQPGTLAVSGLTPATYYTVRVTARDLAGNVSVATSLTFRTKALPTTADSTPPATPTALTARAGSTALTVTWPPVTDNVGVVGYRVTVGGALHEVPAPSLSVEGLTPGTPYAVQVVAVDAAGNPSPPATLNLETRPAPAARGLVGNIAWFGTGTTRASMDEALASPLIDGISVFARWSDVTTDGVAFNFGVFDTARAAAGAAAKPWNGMLVYGVRDNGMPEYVLAGLPPGEVLTISGETFPAFWSASAQAAARDLVTRAATRYGDDPNLVQWRVTGLWATNGEPWFQGGPTGRATWLATYQLDHPGASFEDLRTAYNSYEVQIWTEAAAAWPERIRLAQAAGDAFGDHLALLADTDPAKHPQRLATWSGIRATLGSRMIGQFNGVDAGAGAQGYGVWLPAAFGPAGRYPGRIGAQPIGGVSSDVRLTAQTFREMTRLLTVRGNSYSEFYGSDVLYAVRAQSVEARHLRDTLALYQSAWTP